VEHSKLVLSFGGGRIRLDCPARTLVIDGQAAKPGGRAFDLLEALAARRDRVVPKQELLDVVWPGLVVEENNLQVQVAALRKLLGANSITTVQARGYRFTLEPDRGDGTGIADPGPHAAAEQSPLASARSLIGRDSLVAESVALLQDAGTRLVTLTGPGGSGKTRLGLRTTAELAHAYADGSYVVLLAPIRDPAHVASAVATVLNLQEAGGRTPLDLVAAYLREREALLMFDNFEHVLCATPVVAGILDACPRVKILVTSRTVLHVDRERILVVPPLAVPDRSASGDGLLNAPAVRLFLDRSKAIGREVDRRNADEVAAVADICRRLDGLPLAIELAAARLRVLSPRALWDRLGTRLDLLKGGPGDMPERQRTLRGAIAWSHELLSVAGRTMFRRLAVFVGGWTLDAAEVVCGGSDLRNDVLDILTELMDHSLVQRIDDVGGEPRFAILETVREFAREQLDASGEATTIRTAHAEYFLQLATTAEPQLTSARRRSWLQRLAADYNNIRMALSWFVLERVEADRALAFAGMLPWYWYFSGQYGEGRAWIRLTLNLVGERRDAEVARVVSGAARLAMYSGAVDEAVKLGERSVAMWRETGDRRGLAFALAHEAIPRIVLRQRDAARTLLRESNEHFVALDDPWGVAFATTYEGVSLAFEGGTEKEAYPLLTEGRARFGLLDDEWGVTTSSHYLGSIALRHGDYAAARELTEEMLASARDLGDNYRVARNLHQLAEIALAQDDLASAKRSLVESLVLNRDQGRIGDGAQQLRLLARIAAMEARPDLAARLFGAASPHDGRDRTLPPDSAQLNEQSVATAREKLGDRRFDAEWAHGAAMSLDAATRWVVALEQSAIAQH
jgi:non-specific serine/threonine protein kinase